MCSSWARTSSAVKRGAVGSIHTDRTIRDPPQNSLVGGVQVDATLNDPRRGMLHRLQPPSAGHVGERALQITDRLHHISPCPHRAVGGEPFDDVGEDQPRSRIPGDGLAGVVDLHRQLGRRPPEGGGFGVPAGGEVGGAMTGLAATRVGGCFTSQRSPFPPRRLPPLPSPEPLDLGGEGMVDVDAPLREHRQQLGGDTDDLRLPIDDRPPGDSAC